MAEEAEEAEEDWADIECPLRANSGHWLTIRSPRRHGTALNWA